MINPFCIFNAGGMPTEQLHSVRVDRDGEFELCYEALMRKGHNVLLYGTRGVGKTFLIRLLEHEMRKSEPSVFSCVANIASLAAYDERDELAAFPRAILLQLCTSLWTQLIGKPYTELRDRLDETGQEITFRGRDERTIQSVYQNLMLQQLVAKRSLSNTVGVSLMAKGEKNEQSSLEAKQAPIMPFEFAEFGEQLIADVLLPRGKNRVIILCDESNHIKLYQQEQILERYLVLFSSKRLQFLFVAGVGPWSEKGYIPSCFETSFELKGFAQRDHVQTLVERALTKSESKLRLVPEAYDVLFEAFSGHPRKTLMACEKAFGVVTAAGLEKIDLRTMLRACREIEDIERQYEDSIRSMVKRNG